MNIIMGDDLAQQMGEKYTVLGLDWFSVPGSDQPIRAYCVVETVPLTDMPTLTHWRDLHENLMKNFTKQNWNFCEQAIEHLMGRWNGELDSFYQVINQRIQKRKDHGTDPDWNPTIAIAPQAID